MLHIKRFTVNPIAENTFLVWDDHQKGALIDCGALTTDERERIATFIEKEGIVLEKVLQTHAHFDHVFGLPYIYSRYGLLPFMHSLETDIYHQFHDMLAITCLSVPNCVLPPIGGYLRDGDRIFVGEERLEVIHTPGHTPGGVCFYAESNHTLFSGDTLFRQSVGRTDFPGGSADLIISSIRERLFALPDDTTVLTGHGGRTSIGFEKENNMYVSLL